jgi:hypothetical protein
MSFLALEFLSRYVKFRFSEKATNQRYTHRVLQTIQMKLILSCVWAEPAVLGSTKTALKFKYEINTHTIQCMGQDISLKSETKNT